MPLYRKTFEAAFFLSFLFLYYSVLVERREDAIGGFEIAMDVWIVAFAYDELSGLIDAGVLFYQMDFWSLWNLGIIGVGFAFIITSKSHHSQSALHDSRFPCHTPKFSADGLVTGITGLAQHSSYILNLSFDILSLEALFLVPR